MNNKLDFGLIAGQIGQPGIDSFINRVKMGQSTLIQTHLH